MHKKPVDIFLLSDSTGDTVQSLCRAVMAQFDTVAPNIHVWTLVKEQRQLDQVLNSISRPEKSLVMYTLVDRELIENLEKVCLKQGIPCVSILAPIVRVVEEVFDVVMNPKPGHQHHLNQEYFDRIAAMEFALAHDDGLGMHSILDSDVIVVGVSRTSKTPTTIYLANRGIKAANIPYVSGVALPHELNDVPEHILVVGLTNNPRQLSSIRRTRMSTIDSIGKNSDYDDFQRVKAEVKEAREYCMQHGWEVLDVTNRSIEETSAAIIKKLMIHRPRQCFS